MIVTDFTSEQEREKEIIGFPYYERFFGDQLSLILLG